MITSKRQVINDPVVQARYTSDWTAVINRLDNEHASNVSLLNRNLIEEDEFTRRARVINETKTTELAAIDNNYKATNSIWGPLEVDILFSSAKPTSSNVVIEIDVVFHGGATGSLTGYPDPLLSNETYHEVVSFRTGKYVTSVTAVRIVKK